MNFNGSKLFYSFFSTLIAIFFMFLGIICLIASLRSKLIHRFLDNPLALALFGTIFLIIGIAIIANILISVKHRYYKVRCGNNAILVDEGALQQILDKYWSELFPGYEIPSKVFLKKNHIHISANFPYLPLEEQKSLLQRIDTDLTNAFENTLGYQKEFFLSASFPESTQNP